MNKFEKKCLSRDRDEFKSKESLCRKSQTTDIKFLLKVYNKQLWLSIHLFTIYLKLFLFKNYLLIYAYYYKRHKIKSK